MHGKIAYMVSTAMGGVVQNHISGVSCAVMMGMNSHGWILVIWRSKVVEWKVCTVRTKIQAPKSMPFCLNT